MHLHLWLLYRIIEVANC
uniref:Uncharacterized protein n=1 Tax=Rhizophora mucronata TaxID=61149 RepID=A0A2P2NF63_RHIMU